MSIVLFRCCDQFVSVFVFKQKTAYDMRISDWSSDVCSSDLRSSAMVFYSHGSTGWKSYHAAKQAAAAGYKNVMWMRGGYADWAAGNHPKIGRASCRERVCQYV